MNFYHGNFKKSTICHTLQQPPHDHHSPLTASSPSTSHHSPLTTSAPSTPHHIITIHPSPYHLGTQQAAIISVWCHTNMGWRHEGMKKGRSEISGGRTTWRVEVHWSGGVSCLQASTIDLIYLKTDSLLMHPQPHMLCTIHPQPHMLCTIHPQPHFW